MLTELTLPASEPVSIAAARLAARIDVPDLDEQLAVAISAARAQAEQITGRYYARRQLRMTLNDWPSGPLFVPVVGVSAVAISYWTGVAWLALPALAFEWDAGLSRAGLDLCRVQPWPALVLRQVGGAVRLDMTVGPAEGVAVPAGVQLYIKASVAAWMNTGDALLRGSYQPNPLHAALLDGERLWQF